MPRIYRRVQLDHPAVVAVNPAQRDERMFLVKTIDISASGAMLRSVHHFSQGAIIKMIFILKRGNSQNKKLMVKFTGRIVRSEPGRFAVAFDEVRPITLSSEEKTIKTLE